MTNMVLNVREEVNTQDMKMALEYLLAHHPEIVEDMLLRIKMDETKNDDVFPIQGLKAEYGY